MSVCDYVLQTVVSVDSVLLQRRHLLHPTQAQASDHDQVVASHVLVLIVSAGTSIISVALSTSYKFN